MRKICVLTSARSDYGYLKGLLHKIDEDFNLTLQLVVTGGHLLKEQGNTIEEIIKDGFNITKIVDVKIDNSSNVKISYSISRLSERFTTVFDELKPELLVVLGDRYELLPVCTSAYILKIPIAHISGGDITEGAIDDGIRNAITMLASYHFPGTVNSQQNISRMINSNKSIYMVGEPSLDNYNLLNLLSRNEISNILNIDVTKKWILMTFHPETKISIRKNMQYLKTILIALNLIENKEVIITKANLDFGGKEINNYVEEFIKNKSSFHLFPSLGQLKYFSLMKQVKFVIGNSSSGIVETPFLNIPSIDIGNRQMGRYKCSNILHSSGELEDIKLNIAKALSYSSNNVGDRFYWGDGNSVDKIFKVIKNV